MNTSNRVGHYNKEPAASKAIPKIKAAIAGGASTYEQIREMTYVSGHSITAALSDPEISRMFSANKRQVTLTRLRKLYDAVNAYRDKGMTLTDAIKRVKTNNTMYYKAIREFGKWES